MCLAAMFPYNNLNHLLNAASTCRRSDNINMITFWCLTLLVVTEAEIITDRKCSGIDKFDKEVLVTGYDSPYQLAIDPITNTLFFSYSTEILGEAFKSVYFDLTTKTNAVIPTNGGGFAHAVDANNGIVYIGSTESGIFKFDYETKKAVPLDITKDGIWQMFFKDALYYTTYPDEKAHVYKDGIVKKIEELEHTKALTMGVDNNFNIFFSNSSGLFILKKESGNIVQVADYIVNGFATDSHGNLFFSSPGGLYSVNEGLDIKQILDEDNIYGIVIEGEKTIIYSNRDSIIKLKPNSATCLLDSKDEKDSS